MIMFTVDIKLDDQIPRSKKSDLQVFVEGPGPLVTPNIMGGDRGKFQIGLKPGPAGTYWVDFVFQGIFAAEPFKLPISEGASCPEYPYEGKQRAQGAPATSASTIPASPATQASGSGRPSAQELEAEKKKEDDRVREEEERQRKDEEDRIRVREAEAEHERLRRAEEQERLHHQEQEKLRHQEQERLRHLEQERLRLEEEERARKEAEEKARLARLAEIRSQFAVLSNQDLSKEIENTIEKLQLLVQEQQKRFDK